MSILIKGMEMPKENRLTLQISADGAVYVVNRCRITTETYTTDAVPVPPHGRLIDADAFERFECNRCDGACDVVGCDCTNCDSDCRCDIMSDLHNAPTIIEADESHNERYDFLEFLWNTINPNEMQEYWAMFHCKGVPTNGEAEGDE